jgi:hypothetical protein
MSELRASDADRERTAERLRTAAAEGRLAAEELEQRLEIALSARRLAELQAVVADLPAPVAGRPARRRRAPVRAELGMVAATAVVLVAIWALGGGGYFWPVWPIVGWGLFVTGTPCTTLRRCRRNASWKPSTTR